MDLKNKPGHIYDFSDIANDATHRALAQSMLSLPFNFQLDMTLRYLTQLTDPYVPEYFTFDSRISWKFKRWLELSVCGQDLWESRHTEWANKVPRSIYGRVTCRF